MGVPEHIMSELNQSGWKVINSHPHNINEAILNVELQFNANWDLKDFSRYNWYICHSYSKHSGLNKQDKGKLRIKV